MKKVEIYSTPSCMYCHMAKDFFNENKVSFEDYDVSSNLEKRQEMVEKSGQMGVPVIVLSEENKEDEIIVGFDKDRLSNSLGI